MADSKITALDAIVTIASDDKLAIVDVSDTTQGASGTTKNITPAQLRNYTTQLNSDEFVYFGDSGTNGSWRIGIESAHLVIQKRIGGSWITIGDYAE